MFGRLSYDRDGQEPVFEADIALSNTISSSDSSRRGTTIHKACELCRARKLRCSGDPSGCERCKVSSNACKYPPGTFRAGRKRPRSGLLAAESSSTNYNEGRGGGDFSQAEWQKTSGSLVNEEEIQSLPTHKPLETNYGIGSYPDLMDAFPDNPYVLSGSSEDNFSDLFDVHWQDNQAVVPKTTASIGKLLDLSPQSYKWRGPTASKGSDSDSDPICLTPSDLSVAEPLFDYDWSETTVNTTPELLSGPYLSRSNSLETVRTSADWSEIRFHTDGSYCQCLSLVARLLEQVETQGAKSDTSIDSLLESCREPLRQRKALLACSRCKTQSECILLLAMLAKSLSTVCNSLVHRYVQSRFEGSYEHLALGNEWPEVRVGTYFVEDSAERSTVVEALIADRLNNLQDFLIDLKARAKMREGHLAFLVQVEERVKYLKTLMRHVN